MRLTQQTRLDKRVAGSRAEGGVRASAYETMDWGDNDD
jgi:hypothetical protein